jgi:hypothetical protein
MRPALAAALGLALLAAGPGRAQERPSEEDLFGAPAPIPVEPPPESRQTPVEAPVAPSPSTTPRDGEATLRTGSGPEVRSRGAAPASTDERAADLLGGSRRDAPTGRWDKEKEDPLKVGGLLYARAATSWSRGVPASAWPLTVPSLLDTYLDVRPNDRVRGFVLGRLTYDPTLSTTGVDLAGRPVTRSQTRAVLDQLYVNFDVERTVFVTAGKQHVKWGTGRFWNPGDFLHPVRRDPLAQLDDRSGVAMVRAHLPWEARGWNLYGVALLEDLAGDTTGAQTGAAPGTVGQVGGAARAEVVLGGVELAADLAAQRGHAPRFGFDGSFALWELDVTAELALTRGRDAPAWRATGADPATVAGWRRAAATGTTPQAVVGVTWSWRYSDEDALMLGGEYFFNDAGYDDAHVYPVLLASPFAHLLSPPHAFDPRTAFTPFYLGRHYAGAFLLLPQPGSWNATSLTLSALANLSDGSGLLRLDHSVLLNTYLTLETYLAGHLGKEGGEFRLGFDVPGQALAGGGTTPPFTVPTPILDLGVALRVKL